jgi:hypothetical protein
MVHNYGSRTDGERDTRMSGANPSNRATINATEEGAFIGSVRATSGAAKRREAKLP